MISSAIFLCCFWYDDLITYKTVLLFIPIAILVFAGVGFMRTGFNLSGKSITEIFSRLFDDKLTYEGAIWCYIPTLASIELTYVTSIQEKLLLLAEHIKYTFTLGSAGYNPDLSSYSHKYYSHWYGFLSTSYFYFWFYYPGAILFALLVQGYNKMAQKIISANNTEIFKDVKFTLSYFFISNVGRWYCYGAMGLIRGMFVWFVFEVIFYLANSLLTKKITF
jgi:hypothetical protein